MDSTNTRLKALAADGAPEGTVVLAEAQSAGRGTRGRCFYSPAGQGCICPSCCAPGGVGAAAHPHRLGRRGPGGGHPGRLRRPGGHQVAQRSLPSNGRKLCGILTELSLLGESGEPDYVVLGAGVNLTQSRADFAAQGLGDIATSLALEGFAPERHHLAACVLSALEEMVRAFPRQAPQWLARYRSRCLTPGRRVAFQDGPEQRTGTAVAVDDRFSLVIRGDDGVIRTLSSGTVTLI